MSKSAVILSGITGFLGSHLAENLSKKFLVLGLVRSHADLWRYEEIKNDNILLIRQEGGELHTQLKAHAPKIFIHTAWAGVAAGKRDDWSAQAENVLLTTNYLQLAHQVGVKHFISFGSQAEYGSFSGRIDESRDCKPTSAYGAAKLAALQIQEAFCTQHSMHWNWFRLFSLFGTRENFNWLLPSVIKNALLNQDMELTGCEQRYDYLSMSDVSLALIRVLETEPVDGVMNLSSNSSRTLRSVVEKVIDLTATNGKFAFGALPYRPNQVMHMEGNAELFFNTFHFKLESVFDAEIQQLINYYRDKI